jgi:hypothetical protein
MFTCQIFITKMKKIGKTQEIKKNSAKKEERNFVGQKYLIFIC